MSDDLRTRIAAVICGMDALHAEQWSLDVADAVIRELDSHGWLIDPESEKRRMAARQIPLAERRR